jgi:excisionase family DNA binding protein
VPELGPETAFVGASRAGLGYLRVSKRNLYCWRMAGLVPYFKIGRAVRFRKSELDAALERMRMGAA